MLSLKSAAMTPLNFLLPTKRRVNRPDPVQEIITKQEKRCEEAEPTVRTNAEHTTT